MAPVDCPNTEGTLPPSSQGGHRVAAGRKVKTELNVIPLVDVMFMMILFFVLGAQFRQSEGQIPATLPSMGGPGPGFELQPDKLQISIRSDGGDGAIYEMSGHRGTIHDGAELYQALQARGSAAGGAAVIITPCSETKWQYAVEAFN